MRQVKTIDGETLKQYIFGRNEHNTEEQNRLYTNNWDDFYYAGSPNMRAQTGQARAYNNPTIGPNPFRIPSRKYLDYSNPFNIDTTSGKRYNELEPPLYIIKDSTRLGGNLDYISYSINWKEFGTDIQVDGCTFLSNLSLEFLDTKFKINFTNCTFHNGVCFQYVRCKEITFSECTFNNSVLDVVNCNIDLIKIKNCKNLSIKVGINKSKNLNYSNTYYADIPYNNDIDHEIKSLDIKLSHINSFNISGEKIKNINLSDVTCEEANLNIYISEFQFISKFSQEDKKFKINEFICELNDTSTDSPSILENVYIEDFKLIDP